MHALLGMMKQPLAIFSILAISNLGLSVTALADAPPPPAPAPAQAAAPIQSATSGKITAYTAGSQGELDGFILDSGTTVHFPAHAGFKVKPLLKKGEALSVEGTIQHGPTGQVLEASNIKNLANGQSVNIALIAPPAALPPGSVSPPGMPKLNSAS
jgi:hypothetical protein